MNCPRCGSYHYKKEGILGTRQRYRCQSCFYHYTVEKKSKSFSIKLLLASLRHYFGNTQFRFLGHHKKSIPSKL